MKTGYRNNNLLQGYYKTTKNVYNHPNYQADTSKNTTRKLNFDSQDSPSKFNVKVVDSIQHKRLKVQESGNQEVPVIPRRSKPSKYKGKTKYNRELPRQRTKAVKQDPFAAQRKRSIKREEKEQSEMKDRTAFYKTNPNSKRQGVVNFENLNSKDSLVSHKSNRAMRMAESASGRPKTKPLGAVPPKTKAQKQFDKEWVKGLPEGLSKQQKDHLLSLEDQAERNRELSMMTDSGEGSSRNTKASLAVLKTRKSHIKNKTRYQPKNQSSAKKLDEIHYENFRKSQKLREKRNTSRYREDSGQKYHSSGHKVNALEIVSKIRARGEIARQKSLHNTPRSTQKLRSSKNTPLNKEKLSPVPFPSLDSDKKPKGRYCNFDSLQSQNDMEVDSIAPIEETKETTKLFQKAGIEKLEPEKKPLAVVDKVQNQTKDVSVPLVTQIIRKPHSSFDLEEKYPHRQINKMTPTPIGQGKQIVESIKVQHGNLRSPAKITNRMILPTDEPSLQPLLETDSEFKTPLPKKPKSASKRDSEEKVKDCITTFPMRIDFNVRPKEFDDIILPTKLKLIFDFFAELDNAINNCKRRGKLPVMSNLKPYIQQATGRSFDIDHFRKVFYVSPELYYYSWHPSQDNSGYELKIEIPENIEEIITKVHKRSP